jgi:glycosyltransferase
MKVSIITVSYNSESTIGETINSVINQSYKNIEHIFIDGNSVDGTKNIIESSTHNKIFISERDKGIYDAMNKGVGLATGEIIGILNSDDIFYDDFVIQKIVDTFLLEQNLDIVYGNLVYVKNNRGKEVVRKWISTEYFLDFFEEGNVPPHPSVFLKKSVYELAGNFNLNYSLAADYEFLLRIFKKFNFKSKHIDCFLVKMRLGGATNKNFKNIVKGNKEIIASWKNNGFHIPPLLFMYRFIKRLIQFI